MFFWSIEYNLCDMVRVTTTSYTGKKGWKKLAAVGTSVSSSKGQSPISRVKKMPTGIPLWRLKLRAQKLTELDL